MSEQSIFHRFKGFLRDVFSGPPLPIRVPRPKPVPLPAKHSPGRYLIGYAAASFYGLGRSVSDPRAEESRQRMDEYLMSVCPRECEAVALAMHNHYCRSSRRPPLENWEQYIAQEIEGEPKP